MSLLSGKLRVGLLLLCSVGLLAQNPKSGANLRPGLELPASLQTKVVAGSTPAGTEVRAKLTMATLMDGLVIPEDAVITGHIEQSVAKTSDAPSLLKIKFESARWKKGSAIVNLYLAGCFYPVDLKTAPDGPSGLHGEVGIMMGGGPPDPLGRTNGGISNGGGLTSMDPSRPDSFPDPRPNVTTSEIAKHWIRMEKVDTLITPEGELQITSTDHNIKLDKGTVYLLRTAPK